MIAALSLIRATAISSSSFAVARPGHLVAREPPEEAKDLGIGPKTVDVHRASVMYKLLVSSVELIKLMGTTRSV